MSHLYLGSCGLCVRVVWQKKLATWLHISYMLVWLHQHSLSEFEKASGQTDWHRCERHAEIKLIFPKRERKKKRVRALVRRHRVYLVVGKRNTTRVLRWLCARMTEPSASLLQLSVRLVFLGGTWKSYTFSLYPPPIAPKDGRWLSEQPEFSVVLLPSSFKRDLYLAFTRPTSIYTFTFCRPPSFFACPW